MALITPNLSEAADIAQTTLPSGKYTGEITRVIVRSSRNDNPMVVLRIRVEDGPEQDAYFLVMPSGIHPDFLEMLKSMDYSVARSQTPDVELDELIGKRVKFVMQNTGKAVCFPAWVRAA